jgi:hypothetical protein
VLNCDEVQDVGLPIILWRPPPHGETLEVIEIEMPAFLKDHPERWKK